MSKKFVGFWNVSVILTYIELCIAVGSICAAADGKVWPAVIGLALCGLCDMFDGKIARATKRTKDAEVFGIQIDSLNDLVCFGVLPAAIGWSTGCDALWFLATMSFFALCALIRLAYFNVSEEERQDKTNENRAYYLGVPVTASAVLAPLFYLLSLHFSLNCAVVYALGLFLLGVLYITPIRVKKPQLRGVALLSIFGLGEFAVLLRVLTH